MTDLDATVIRRIFVPLCHPVDLIQALAEVRAKEFGTDTTRYLSREMRANGWRPPESSPSV